MARSHGRLATHVGAGILLARILGFVRERVFAHYFGDSMAADAYRAALRIPNVIRNLLGEGTLSASFIPVYAGMIERGEHDDARRLSGVIASLLVLATAVAALVGVVLAPVITDVVAPGFSDDTRALTITLVEIMFPMSGVMILSAWCLGILNTHRKFFLSYAAPAVWNIAQIATLVGLAGVLSGQVRLVVALAWGALAGSILQVIVQLPTTLRLVRGIAVGLGLGTPGVRRVITAWLPVVVGAGVYQISSVVDTMLASELGEGSVAILGYAQLVALLPVSLFGVSVAAVALPELSRELAGDQAGTIRIRLADATRRIAFYVLPSAAACAALGPLIIGSLFQTGAFRAHETAVAGGVLAAYAIAIPAQASLKLFASGHYAFGDTRTPVRIAIVSVIVSAVTAFLLMQRMGPEGIALGAAAGGYINMALNFGMLTRRTGRILDSSQRWHVALSVLATVPAALSGIGVARWLQHEHLWIVTAAALAAFLAVYGVITIGLRHPEAMRLVRKGNEVTDG